MGDSTHKQLQLGLEVSKGTFAFSSLIATAQDAAHQELVLLKEDSRSLAKLKPDCDKWDYALAASSGALCGIFDVFLVGKPSSSPLVQVSDQWFAERTKDFARFTGWSPEGDGSLASALRHLEKKFAVPYDQNGLGESTKMVFDLYPANHHFKSLGHNPTLLGLFFSILDQFSAESHFVSEGELIVIDNPDGGFALAGGSFLSKLFAGLVNWLGHLISDCSGSSSSVGRGMGIPSPFWSWVNDVAVLRRKMGIPSQEFDRSLNDFALKIYQEGFDFRFQSIQLIPVFINESLTRLLYSIRRMICYFKITPKGERSLTALWNAAEPFTNASVKRMLSVAHGTFCLVDVGDASIRAFIAGGGSFNAVEFFLRLNLVGIARFGISLYDEASRALTYQKAQEEACYAEKEQWIVENYLSGLDTLSHLYDDRNLLTFVEDFKGSAPYQAAFAKSVRLAELRQVPAKEILHSKEEIDTYFKRGKR
jgi:hypothetical protein